ncbi:MAG: hypothetical protein R3E88_06455 [Myxococcota bacterium]
MCSRACAPPTTTRASPPAGARARSSWTPTRAAARDADGGRDDGAPERADGADGAGAEVALVGGRGRALFDAFRTSAEARDGAPDPLDRFVRRGLRAARDALRAAARASAVAHYDERRASPGGVPTFVDLLALARAAGVGAPSPLGLLVHPELGPWWSLRALVAADGALGAAPAPPCGERAPAPSPCDACPAPCVSACPGHAVRRDAPFDVRACGSERILRGGCAAACAARRACPVGRAHAYDADAEAHHQRAAAVGLAATADPPRG